jgi:hypothetical protein
MERGCGERRRDALISLEESLAYMSPLKRELKITETFLFI